jgi:hypothetical protein
MSHNSSGVSSPDRERPGLTAPSDILNSKNALRSLDKINRVIQNSLSTFYYKINDRHSVNNQLSMEQFTDISRKNRHISKICMEELSFMLKSSGCNEFSTTIRNLFNCFNIHYECFNKFTAEYLRDYYKDLNKQIQDAKSRGMAAQRNAKILEDLVTKLTSSEAHQYELGLAKAASTTILGPNARKSVQNFATRNSLSLGSKGRSSNPFKPEGPNTSSSKRGQVSRFEGSPANRPADSLPKSQKLTNSCTDLPQDRKADPGYIPEAYRLDLGDELMAEDAENKRLEWMEIREKEIKARVKQIIH